VLGLILLLSFVSIMTLIVAIYDLVTEQKRLVGDRLITYTSGETFERQSPIGNQDSRLSLKSLFQKASKVFATRGFTVKVERDLIKADIPLKGEEFILLNVLTATVPPVLSIILFGNSGLAVVTLALGAIMPRLVVGMAQGKRLSRFNYQIGDSLIVMANALRAGFSFLQAVEMVGREMPAPIATEFNRTLREMNLGTPMDEALVNLTRRVPSDDLDLVITAVLIQRHVGGNLAEVLDNISQTIRERVRIKGEIKTLTAQGRISGLVIGLLPIAIAALLMVINPVYIGTLFSTPIGWVVVTGGLVSEVFGVILIRKIVAIEV